MSLTAGKGKKRRMAEDAALFPAMSPPASAGQKRRKGQGVQCSLKNSTKEVLVCLRRMVRCIVPDFDVSLLKVHRMGSRWYGLDGPESDFDMYATVPGEVYINIQLRSSIIGALNLEHLFSAVNVSSFEMFESRVGPSRLKKKIIDDILLNLSNI